MLASKLVRLKLGTLLAADTATLNQAANENELSLVTNTFTPSENLTTGSFTIATFTGSAALLAELGAQTVGIDPATGQQVITIKAPAGGWVFTCTAAPGAPEQITGAILTLTALGSLLAMVRFENPVTISAVGDQVIVEDVSFTLPFQPLN